MSNKGYTGILARVEAASNALERAKRNRDDLIARALDSHSFREVMRAAGLRSPHPVQQAQKRSQKRSV